MGLLWTVMAMDIKEAQRKKIVLILAGLGLGLLVLTVAVGIGLGLQQSQVIADLALRGIQQVTTLLGLILGAGILSEASGITGLVIRPVSRTLIVAGRFLASLFLLALLAASAGAIALLLNLLSEVPGAGAMGIIETVGVILLNSALAVALAMLLSVRLPWVSATVGAWLILTAGQTIFQLSTLGAMVNLPVALIEGARLVSFLLPHPILSVSGLQLPAGVQFLSIGWQALWISGWILALVYATTLLFRRKNL